MLARLTVSNLAVIEKAEAEFAPGLNVLTGETGAGKSVLMGAIALSLGARADSTVVRDGAKDARVEAVFQVEESVRAAISALLDEVGLEPCEGDELVIRRVIPREGSGRIWVNDSPVTAATVRKIGGLLVDVHGPRANQNLLIESYQRAALDQFGKVDLHAYEAAYRVWRAACARLEESRKQTLDEDAVDLLRFQVSELEDAALDPDDDTLAERHAQAAHAEETLVAATAITEGLSGEAGATEILARLAPEWVTLGKTLESDAWQAEADDVAVRLQELSRSVADAVSRLEVDPEEFETMDQRLGLINRLKRKYAGDLGADESLYEKLSTTLADKKARLDAWENREEALKKLAAEAGSARAIVVAEGQKVSVAREKVAKKLSTVLTRELHDLGFLQARILVSVAAHEPDVTGCDTVSFGFEPNPGESMRPLAAVASSGEIARVMLALKRVLAEHDRVGTLIFDEIDANIGGETGRAVGEKMRAVAASRQVIAITHLPQSAAFGAWHLVVSKHVTKGRTMTEVKPIEGQARIVELARMLGGAHDEVVLRHAEGLLNSAGVKEK